MELLELALMCINFDYYIIQIFTKKCGMYYLF